MKAVVTLPQQFMALMTALRFGHSADSETMSLRKHGMAERIFILTTQSAPLS